MAGYIPPQTSRYLAFGSAGFDADFGESPAPSPVAPTRDAPPAPATTHSTQRAGSTPHRIPPPLSVVDPFSEPVFPDQAQTPPRMKPRPKAGAPAANAQPASSPLGAVRKRCVVGGCENDRFARGYCALHLSDVTAKGGDFSGPAPTPTSRTRSMHRLWAHECKHDKEKHRTHCMWRILHNEDVHVIELVDQLFEGVRLVTINNARVFCGQIDLGSWTLDATIGKHKETNINCKVVVTPHIKGYSYELLVDDRTFEDAHTAFLAALSSTSVIQRIELSERDGGDHAVEELHASQLRDSLYVKQNWASSTDEEKTAMAGVKSKINWHFTIKGQKHLVVLEYGSLSGKKKLLLDGDVVVEQKPSILSANKHKRWSHTFKVDRVECEVTAVKNKDHIRDPRAPSEQPRPYLFNLTIDHVPFENCILTEQDLAGGNVALDSEVAAKANRPPISAARRKSVHAPLTSEEYEAALAEENERDRHAAHPDSDSD